MYSAARNGRYFGIILVMSLLWLLLWAALLQADSFLMCKRKDQVQFCASSLMLVDAPKQDINNDCPISMVTSTTVIMMTYQHSSSGGASVTSSDGFSTLHAVEATL